MKKTRRSPSKLSELERYALKLVDQEHVWTPVERRLYQIGERMQRKLAALEAQMAMLEQGLALLEERMVRGAS